MGQAPRASIISMAFVVTGNLLGAGILALPVNTGLSGFIPSLVSILLMWAAMFSTALILASQKHFAESPTADLPSFFGAELGAAGKWITVLANLVILYGLLTAYLSGAASVLEDILGAKVPGWALLAGFFLVASLLTVFGMKIMSRCNAVLMVFLFASFILLVIFAARFMKPERLVYTDWSYLPATLPIVVTAFHFHNIIPTICRSMNFDFKAAAKAMFIGMGIGFVMNSLWVLVAVGALPLAGSGSDTLLHTFQTNLPATVPLADLIRSPAFTIGAMMFALVAITTSFMANGTALLGFVSDLTTRNGRTPSRIVVLFLALGPPLLIALVYPAIFLKALDVVGGVGIVVIFGILPGVLLAKQHRGKLRLAGIVLVAVFSVVLLYEIGQETGMLQIEPAAEYWHTGSPHVVPQ